MMTQTAQFKNPADATAFMLAGNATITLRSMKTQTRFTYRIRKSDDGRVHFVSLMTGTDNEGSFRYIGVIRSGEFATTRKTKIDDDAPGIRAFDWAWHQLSIVEVMPAQLEVWHEGKCGRCNRKLTVPESIARGIGPECATRMECVAA